MQLDLFRLSNLATLPHTISSLCTYVYSIKSIAYTPSERSPASPKKTYVVYMNSGYCEKQPPDVPEKDRRPETALELDDPRKPAPYRDGPRRFRFCVTGKTA